MWWVCPFLIQLVLSAGSGDFTSYALSPKDLGGVPASLASADFDGDGMPDLVVGLAGETPRAVVLRGNVDALFPFSPAARERKAKGTFDETPLLMKTRFNLSDQPQMLAAGDFDGDSLPDLVFASGQSGNLYFLAGRGDGEFDEPVVFAFPGQITALTSGEINRRDGLADLAVAVAEGDQAQLFLFQDATGALGAEPLKVTLPTAAGRLLMAFADEDGYGDLVAAGSQKLMLVRGGDWSQEKRASNHGRNVAPLLESFTLPADILAMTSGRFGQGNIRQLAVFTADGRLALLHQAAMAQSLRKGSHVGDEGYELSVAPSRDLNLLPVIHKGQAGLELAVWTSSGMEVLPLANPSQSLSAKGVPSRLASEPLPISGGIRDVLPMRLNRDPLTDYVVAGEWGLELILTGAGSTFVVNTLDLLNDGTCDLAHCSLMEAILATYLDPSTDTISFSGLPPGSHTIMVDDFLPTIPSSILDGTTHPDGRMELNFSNGGNGLFFSGASTVRGMVVNNLSEPAINVAANSFVEGNYLGLDFTGTTAAGADGVRATGSGSQIGGTVAAARNVISGSFGIEATGPDHIIQGNYIGFAADGTTLLPQFIGVRLIDADNFLFGGTTAGAGNRVRGFESTMTVRSTTTGGLIQGNQFGAVGSGAFITGSGLGLETGTSMITVGGTAAGARNIFQGVVDSPQPLEPALSIAGSDVQVLGNWFGLSDSGTSGGANAAGIDIAGDNNIVGGTAPGAANVLGGQQGRAITVLGNNNQIRGNLIGFEADGTTPLGNGWDGILLGNGASGNLIGGDTAASENQIANNGHNGVFISGSAGTGNTIARNRIFDNDRRGIVLTDGIDDPGDEDEGANRLQNAPNLLDATIQNNGDYTITYTVDSDPARADYPLTIRFFRIDDLDSREGKDFLGQHSFTAADFTAGSATANLGHYSLVGINADERIVATATDFSGNSSEFSFVVQNTLFDPLCADFLLDLSMWDENPDLRPYVARINDGCGGVIPLN